MKIIDDVKYYSLAEVAQLIGKTRCTILRWYEYEEECEKHLLPPYITIGKNHAKYWCEYNLYMFDDFIAHTPRGAMNKISAKYSGKKVNIDER